MFEKSSYDALLKLQALIESILKSYYDLPVTVCKTLILHEPILRLVPLFVRDTLPGFEHDLVIGLVSATDFWSLLVLSNYHLLINSLLSINGKALPEKIAFPKRFNLRVHKMLFGTLQ